MIKSINFSKTPNNQTPKKPDQKKHNRRSSKRDYTLFSKRRTPSLKELKDLKHFDDILDVPSLTSSVKDFPDLPLPQSKPIGDYTQRHPAHFSFDFDDTKPEVFFFCFFSKSKTDKHNHS